MPHFLLRPLFVCIILAVCAALPTVAQAGDDIPLRYGIGAAYAASFNTSGDIDCAMGVANVSAKYNDLFDSSLSENLHLKLEGLAGASTTEPRGRFVGGVALIGQYYLDALSTQMLKPYVEAGMGIGFTDFEVSRQGTRCNFLSLGGIGTDIVTESRTYFASLHVQHLSNADTNDDNRGLNALRLTVGLYF
ncbi:MAG: acyloxyacyl hydrolase [Desulfovibrionaceae bacterium]